MNGTRPDKSKLYYPKMPSTWWLKTPAYFLFMLRELSSVFIALFLIVYLTRIYQLTHGPQAYAASFESLRSPGWIIFHALAFLFAVFHSVTWFQSTAVVMPVRVGGKVLPPRTVTAVNIGAWIVISLIVLILFVTLRG